MSEYISSRRAEKKIAKAKAKARPELLICGDINEWTSLHLYQKFDYNLNVIAQKDFLPRINVRSVTKQEFIDNYEKPLKPVILTHVVDDWPANKNWNLDKLLKRYRNERFKCGEDDYGYNVKMKMKYFIYYMNTNCDDSPLYIFDGNFGEHPRKKNLLNDYKLPAYFEEDLFKYAGKHRRPPYRWIVIGSARSGTGIHIDPLGTSAWNALLIGYKRWCLFPTTTPKELVKINSHQGGKQSTEAAQWFNIVYPHTQHPSWPPEYRPIEVLQRPGETVFVPSGWWHVVMNLSDTVAITQNFVSTSNFPIVWHKTVKSRPKLSAKWLSQLQRHRPDLVEVTKHIDLNSSIGITSDSSSDSSSSSSTCSSCSSISESEDSGQASLSKRKRRYTGDDNSGSSSCVDN